MSTWLFYSVYLHRGDKPKFCSKPWLHRDADMPLVHDGDCDVKVTSRVIISVPRVSLWSRQEFSLCLVTSLWISHFADCGESSWSSERIASFSPSHSALSFQTSGWICSLSLKQTMPTLICSVTRWFQGGIILIDISWNCVRIHPSKLVFSPLWEGTISTHCKTSVDTSPRVWAEKKYLLTPWLARTFFHSVTITNRWE